MMERRSAYPDISVFGSPLRTAILVVIALLETSHLGELARLLDVNRSAVQRVIKSLERDGLIATRISGSERRVTLNTTYYASSELRKLLLKIGEAVGEYPRMLSELRRRPRRISK